MIGKTSGLEKSVLCTAAVAVNTIAKFGANDNTLSTATAATDNIIGVFQHATTTALDEVRVMLDGIAEIKLGVGGITRGGPVTSDATGLGVAAVSGNNIIGFAMASGVAGDIVPVLISPQILTSPGGVNGHTFKLVATAIIDVGAEMAVGAHGLGVTIPDDAIITRAYFEVKTAFVSTGNNGTLAIHAQAADDLYVAADPDQLQAGSINECIPDGTAAKMIKLTAARELTATVATNKFTAGKAVVFVEYILGI